MESLAIEYLQYAAKKNAPVYFFLLHAGDRAKHSHAIRHLSKLKLIQKVGGYGAQHWQITAEGLNVVQNGYELSAVLSK